MKRRCLLMLGSLLLGSSIGGGQATAQTQGQPRVARVGVVKIVPAYDNDLPKGMFFQKGPE